jgi:hypothetical protein
MLLLITDASVMGKSSVRTLLTPALEPEVECVELGGVVPVPTWPDLAWRQRAALLDATAKRQEERLRRRGDPDDALLPDHVAFAGWMRAHAEDPSHTPEVLTGGGWEEMRWERWVGRRRGEPGWNVARIDTSELCIDEVATAALTWVRASLRGETPPLIVADADS